MMIELKRSNLLFGVAAVATGSVSFTGALAVTMTARAEKQPSGQPPTAAQALAVGAAIASTQQVFDDQPEPVRVSNAQLVARALADQSTQLRQSRPAPTPNLRRSSQAAALASASVQPAVQPRPAVQWAEAIDATEAATTVRVSIARSSTLSIGSDANFAITDDQGQVVQDFGAMQAVSVVAGAGRLQVDGVPIDRPLWLQPANEDALVFVNDRWYRGVVQLIPEGNMVRVVNHVGLEQYLYSVVGSEMPFYWNFEALKAQAIAARSYVLFHMSRSDSRSYDLTNTQRHQVYSGVSGETEAAYAAVSETTGLVAVGQDGSIFQTMYAATDEVVADAHLGSASMSQTGAALKADGGWNFAEILAYYYPSTAIAALSVATN
jgi:hypothetical protein